MSLTELTLPPEYREILKPHKTVAHEIRATAPWSTEEETMTCVTATKNGTFLVEYWPEGANSWQLYAQVDSLEEGVDLAKTIVMMGLSVFLERS